MKLKNENKLYTNEQIRKAVAFVKPSNVSNFELHLTNRKSLFSGRACNLRVRWADPYIKIKIGEMKFPLEKYKNGGYLACWLYSYDEVLIYVLAHELRHCWQAKIKKGYRVWNAKGQYSERDADAYAIHMVREWRRKS